MNRINQSILRPILGVFKRIQTHKFAKRYDGVYETLAISGRDVGPAIECTFLTRITARPWWSAEPGVLDYQARDWDASHRRVREHYGYVEISSKIASQATRTLIYSDSHEIAHQEIEFGNSPNILHVSPGNPDTASTFCVERTGALIFDSTSLRSLNAQGERTYFRIAPDILKNKDIEINVST